MHIFFSVGEPSGDQHAAHLMSEIQQRRPDVKFAGFGGPLMESAGLKSVFRLTDLAVMGFFRIIPMIFKFYRVMKKAERYFAKHKPDAVVLVDFPGFNWWIARKAKAANIPVFYYMPPQLWAWASYRVKRIKRFVDHVITSLPFEKEWYARHGVEVKFVGHPFFDEIKDHVPDERFLETWKNRTSPTVAILPGSRNNEIQRNWTVMLDVIKKLNARHPSAKFVVACYSQEHRRHCLQEFLVRAPALPVHFFVGKTHEIIDAADCAMMVSGSVSLELMAQKKPAVVLYRIPRPTFWLGSLLVKCKYVSLPNLIADKPIMPEFISYGNPARTVQEMTDVVDLWLRLPEERMRIADELGALADEFAQTGATSRTAEFIIGELESKVIDAPVCKAA
jgi:lipid-A-disaccharide synthase